jgi:hypothetical protein
LYIIIIMEQPTGDVDYAQNNKLCACARTSVAERGAARSGEERKHLQQMLLTLIEKADFLVEDDLNALMSVLPDRDKLLLKVH